MAQAEKLEGHIKSRARAVLCNMEEDWHKSRKSSLLNKLVPTRSETAGLPFFF